MSDKFISLKDQNKYSKREWTRIINCLSGFKSVNLIGTVNNKKKSNLSVISSCFHVGANPPLMGFILRPHSNTSPRHTLININETGYFTVNHVTKDIFKKAHQTSARYSYGESEFDKAGLSEEYKNDFKAPFVKETKIQIGLKLIEVIKIEYNDTQMVLGEIEQIYLPEISLKEDGFVDIGSAGSLALSGLDSYHETSWLTRLSYAKPDQALSLLNISGREEVK